MIDPTFGATVALAAFAGLSFVDGIVLHLVVERLPSRPDSSLEHLLHTGRALLFPAILITFFGAHGPAVLAATLLALDQALELWDMAIERGSRTHSGGLPSREYLLHGLLVTLRSAAIVFVLMIDRALDDTHRLDSLVSLLLPGAILAGVAHVVLATAPGRALLMTKKLEL